MISVSQTFINKLNELGYKSLTPIQKIGIPIILKGKNTIVIAPTGFGKTETAIFPVFYKILSSNTEKISTIYITPLRALNRDLEDRLSKIGSVLGIKIAIRHGDSTERQRKRILEDPPDLLLTTPETLLYLLVNQKIRELLGNIRWIIIDELQEMLDEKRGYELLLAIQRLKRLSKHEIQLIGLSATIGDIELAKRFIGRNVEVAEYNTRKDVKIELVIPTVSKDLAELSYKTGLHPDTLARIRELERLIRENRPVLVFTNVRESTEFLASELSKLSQLKVRTHHGSLSREIRLEAEKEFKTGNLDALIATSSLELGIDIGAINGVIQYTSPKQVIRLVQRIGRSGHSINKVSSGFLLPSHDIFDILECKSIIDNLKEGYLEKPIVEPKPYDVMAHEIAGLVLEGITDKKEIFNLIKSSFQYNDLTEEEFEETLSILESARIIRNNKDKISPAGRLWRYYYSTNMIPDSIKDYIVIDHISNTKIGTLDYEFVATLDENTVFILGGKIWRVVSIEENRIYVENAQLKSGVLPSWFGESIPVEREISIKVYDYIERIERGEQIDLPKEILEKISSLLEEQKRRGYPVPTKSKILVEINNDLIVLHAGLGSRGNNTLGALLSLLLTQVKGVRTTYRCDPYHIAIASLVPVSKEEFTKAIKILNSLSSSEFEDLLKRAIKESPQYKWKLLIEAERFGLIDKQKTDITFSQTLLKAYTDTLVGEEAVKELMYKNYDVTLKEFLTRLTWECIEVPGFSPLAKEFLNKLFVAAHSDEKGVMIEIFKRKLLNNKVKIICMVCGWNNIYYAAEVPDRCTKCGSIFLTVTDEDDKESVEIVKKVIKGSKISKNEKKRFEILQNISSMFSTYKKYVAIGLSARGVGINNIGKVLNKLSDGEDRFFESLLEEERKFLRTRKYWQ
ncbi:helicase [Sulfolobus acidocaldarius SUSAZ]|nr:helicase [Sulfolobus acidocaldarius SUSAZ]